MHRRNKVKKIKLTVEVECKDSTKVSGLMSDLADALTCDAVKSGVVMYEENKMADALKFENSEFEEE